MVPLDIIGRGGAAAGGLGSPLAESMLMLARALASCPRASDSMAFRRAVWWRTKFACYMWEGYRRIAARGPFQPPPTVY